MLISDSHEFIFIRMRKVASTSMQDILRPFCIPKPSRKLAHLKSRARLEWDYHHYVFRAHEGIMAGKQRMPVERFKRYFKFAFVRNPWSRLVSEYEFILKRPEHGRHQKVRKLGHFRAFIEMQIPRDDAYQWNMLTDSSGKLLMNFIGKIENLDKDWQTVCERTGIGFHPLAHKNVTQHQHYQDYFDQESRQLVARHWANEIEQFEYTFDH